MTERNNTPTLASTIRGAIDARLVDVHTAMPARVETYDAATQKVSVQPLIRRGYVDERGDRATERLPVITEVPVVFPGAGGFRVTFPVQPGDTVLLVFSEASLDRWLVRGGEVDPDDDRRHALTDAIAIPGLRAFGQALASAPADVMTAGRDGGPVIEFDTSEIRVGGSQALATKADIDALASVFSSHTHLHVPGPGTVTVPTDTPLPTAPSATGTTILKGS
jgi:hypothetical protein